MYRRETVEAFKAEAVRARAAKEWDSSDYFKIADDLRKEITPAQSHSDMAARTIKDFGHWAALIEEFARALRSTGEPPSRWHKDSSEAIKRNLPKNEKRLLKEVKKLREEAKSYTNAVFRVRKLLETSVIG